VATQYRCSACGELIGEYTPCPPDGQGTGLAVGGVVLAFAAGWCKCGRPINFYRSAEDYARIVARISRTPELSYLVETIGEEK
jgi:hypothetical protein